MDALIITVLIKATLLLLFAGALTVLGRRAAAARRHLVWVLALAGVIALPAAEVAVPAWRLPLLPAMATPSEPATNIAVPPSAGVRQSTPAPATVLVPSSTSDRVTMTPARAIAPLTWLAMAWLVGAALVLGACAFGSWRIARLAGRAQPVTAPDWVRLLARLRADLGVSRPVRLVAVAGPAMPMTWGTRRPVILLPADATLWSESRRRDVLLHELAHVARRDCLTQLIGVCACALYWFHPLAWLAASRLRIERERACDDRVLAAGPQPSAYAEVLLAIEIGK